MKERWFSALSGRRIAGQVIQCIAGLVGLAVLTLVCYRADLNLATAGLVLMILLIGLSLIDSFLVSAVLSVAAIAAPSFFFARPLFSFWVDNPKDLLALVTVLVVLLLVAGIRANRRRVAEALKRSEMYLAEAQRVSQTGSFGWNVRRGLCQAISYGRVPVIHCPGEMLIENQWHPDFVTESPVCKADSICFNKLCRGTHVRVGRQRASP